MKRTKTDTLFLAVTRPAMTWGVPIEVGAILLSVTCWTLFATHRPIPCIVIGALAYFICRVATNHDHNIFRLLHLWIVTKLRGMRNSSFWGGSSASPTSIRKLKHASEISSCLD